MLDLFSHEIGDEDDEMAMARRSRVFEETSDHDQIITPSSPIDIPGPSRRRLPQNGPSGISLLIQGEERRASQAPNHGSNPVHPTPQAVSYQPQPTADELADCEHAYAGHNYTGKTPSEIAQEVKSWNCDLPIPAQKDIVPEHNGPPVTVGAEWECLIDPQSSPYGSINEIPATDKPAPIVGYRDALNNSPQVHHVVMALSKAGFKAATAAEISCALSDLTYCNKRFPDVDLRQSRNARFNQYVVVSVDASVCDDRWNHEHQRWKAIEISSQVVTIDRLDEIRAAFSVILETFRVKVNGSYGLHVHVGNGLRGFSNVWLRSVAALVWASSPLFDSFHPSSRGPCNAHARGLRYFSTLATDHLTLSVEGGNQDPANDYFSSQPDHDLRPALNYHVPGPRPGRPSVAYGPVPPLADSHPHSAAAEANGAWKITGELNREGFCPECASDIHMPWRGVVRLLDSPKSRETLRLLRNATALGGRLSYNFDNLRSQGSELTSQPRTIEFRQHAGTTDVDEICHWASVCAAIVSASRPVLAKDRPEMAGIAHANNPKVVDVALKSIRGCLNQTQYDVYDVLLDIGAKDQYAYYLRDHLHFADQPTAQERLEAIPNDETLRHEHNVARPNAPWQQNLEELGHTIQGVARGTSETIRETVGEVVQGISNFAARLNLGQGSL